MKRLLIILCATLCGLAAVGQEWASSQPGYRFAFPRDHGPHPDYKIEWWYFTGNVESTQGTRFGYQLTFFRIGAVARPVTDSPWALRDVWMAHFAVSDLSAEHYHHADRLNRAGPGLAGADEQRIWNEDWSCVIATDRATRADTFHLRASDRGFSLDLRLTSQKPAVMHGRDGISQKGATPGNASHYYSLTRLASVGTITLAGTPHEVTGESWMDHEFGTSFLEKDQQGWDWFSAQLSDGSELMLFQLRRTPGIDNAETPARDVSAGTLVRPDGSTKTLGSADFRLTPGSTWTSPASKAAYPVTWQIEIPSEKMSLTCRAATPAQEFRAQSTPGLNYWEGAVDFSGKVGDKPVSGRGYLEMTGYAGRSMSAWFGSSQ